MLKLIDDKTKFKQKQKFAKYIKKFGSYAKFLKKYKKKPEEIPSHYLCNIKYELFFNPYITSVGMSYEKKAIRKHFDLNNTDPSTNEQVSTTLLIHNRALKQAVNHFIKTNPFSVLEEDISDWKQVTFKIGENYEKI